jgi:hypothetical protein
MSAAPEALFSARVRAGLKACGCDVERIENRVNLGVSDMFIGAGSQFAAVELKVVSRGLAVKLRPHQISFLTRHALKGRPAFVLVKYSVANEIRIYNGDQAIALSTEGLRLAPFRVWQSRGMPWEELAGILSGRNK